MVAVDGQGIAGKGTTEVGAPRRHLIAAVAPSGVAEVENPADTPVDASPTAGS